MTEISYNYEEFKGVFERITSLERTALCASDYEKCLQREVEEVQILLKPNAPLIKDLFDLDGTLKNVGWTFKDNEENTKEWDINSVYWAYLGSKEERPYFDYASWHYPEEIISTIVRKSLHTLDDLIENKGCNLLVSFQEQEFHLSFFNLVIPARKIIKNPYR